MPRPYEPYAYRGRRADIRRSDALSEATEIDNQTRLIQNIMDAIYKQQAASAQGQLAEQRRSINAVAAMSAPGGGRMDEAQALAKFNATLEEARSKRAARQKDRALTKKVKEETLGLEKKRERGPGAASQVGKLVQDFKEGRINSEQLQAGLEKQKGKPPAKSALGKAEDELSGLRAELAQSPDNEELVVRTQRAESNVKRLSGVTAATDKDFEKNLSSAKTLMSDIRTIINASKLEGGDSLPITGVAGAAKATFGGLARQVGIPVSQRSKILSNKLETLKGIMTPLLLNEKKVTDTERERVDRIVGNIDIWTDDVSILSGLRELDAFLSSKSGEEKQFEEGKIYIDADGNKARYQGGTFVPEK